MKSFWNFLKKNKLYGAINLVGLTVSMAFVLLLAVYVQRQLTTDSFQKNADRIYVIANEDNVTMGYWLDKHLKNNFPEIEKGCCVANVASADAFTIGGELVGRQQSRLACVLGPLYGEPGVRQCPFRG